MANEEPRPNRSSCFPVVLLCGALLVGSWYVLARWEIVGLGDITFKPRPSDVDEPSQPTGDIPPTARPVLRIASHNVTPLNHDKLLRDESVNLLVDIVRSFDIVAMLGVNARNRGVAVHLLEQVNAQGRHYDFVLPENIHPDEFADHPMILFDRASVEVDPATVYLLEDPARRMQHRPLTASFRARGADPSVAFTFTLLCVHVAPHRTKVELDLLDDTFRAVRDNGRGEDDVLLMGTLSADDTHLGELGAMPQLMCLLSDVPTTTLGTALADNLLLDRNATVEFTGRCGVFDPVRESNVTLQQAEAVSEHLPIWAEFSVIEGAGRYQPAAQARTEY